MRLHRPVCRVVERDGRDRWVHSGDHGSRTPPAVPAVSPQAAPAVPDARGRFGVYGGRYVPEVLIPALEELAEGWRALRVDAEFRDELNAILGDVVGRPT